MSSCVGAHEEGQRGLLPQAGPSWLVMWGASAAFYFHFIVPAKQRESE